MYDNVAAKSKVNSLSNRHYMILGFGYPRSGTMFTMALLANVGLHQMYILHERMGTHGSVGYNMAKADWPTEPIHGELRWRPALKDFRIVFHLVRDPRKAIASAEKNLSTNPKLVRWADQFGGFKNAWYEWNLKCERRIAEASICGCYTSFAKLEEIVDFANHIKYIYDFKNSAEVVAEEIKFHNARDEYVPYKWSDLPANVVEMANRYGYNTEEE